MPTAFARRQPGRTDRHVRHGRLSLPSDAPRHKLAFVVEEALRLCSLPGEDQGRVYYFRRQYVGDLPEDGDRHAWTQAFQNVMLEQAARAIHGSDPRAAAADAVYFDSQQEACETLLSSIAARNIPLAWYWRHVSGVDRISSAPVEVVATIEKLLSTQASWTAVAAAVFSVARHRDILPLLRMLPDEALEFWLREMGETDSAYAAPIRLSETVVADLFRAIAAFSVEAPPVVWLAALAVIAAKPWTVVNRSAVRIARSSLRALRSSGVSREIPLLNTPRDHQADKPCTRAPAAELALPGASKIAALPELLIEAPEAESDGTPVKTQAATHPGSRQRGFGETTTDPLPGEPTSAAGLFFLLNALRFLEMEKQDLGLLFLARLFRCIANHCEIVASDPILRWCEIVEAESEPENTGERLLRIWIVRIRRWCWKNGRISLREIVRRPGYVTLTRTDLDVTLSIDTADVRIRRIGLDLDPGWLPWFGRVVRFHYRYRGEIYA